MADRATGKAEASKSSRPTLVVICNEESLRGKLEDAGLGYTLDGEPTPASELRRMACNANILPAVMNGAGQILDWGREHRTATDIQRLALLTMYGGCIIDGCTCPTQFLEIHHLLEWDRGGLTNLDAMAPLCKGDHARGHAERWTYARGPDGTVASTTPNGTQIPTRRPRCPASARAAREPAQSATGPPGSLFDLN
jgi:hypothetical protein